MNATQSVSSLLSDEACAAMRAAGLIDEEGNLLRAPVAGAIAEGTIWNLSGVTRATVRTLATWLGATQTDGEA